MIKKVIKLIEKEEGWREIPYYCSEGYPTVGYGFKLSGKNEPLPAFVLPRRAGDAWLSVIIDDIEVSLLGYDWYKNLSEPRKAIIISMCYQIGISGVLKFKNMINAIEGHRYKDASSEMLDSKWARQTPQRANRHSDQFARNDWIDYYS